MSTTKTTTTTTTIHHPKKVLLLSLDSFNNNNDTNKENKDEQQKEESPDRMSILCTVGFIFCFLWLVEHTLIQFIILIQHLHPLLQDETNRSIMAKHIGVNAFSCFVVASLGWKARHILFNDGLFSFGVVQGGGGGGGGMTKLQHKKKTDIDDDDDETIDDSYAYRRVFHYYPEAARILVFFTGFQFKNLVDSIVWNHPPEFIAHHVLALFSSLGGLDTGLCGYYGIFYMGLSELSTGILCLLANFDDTRGVPGLGDAFPLPKAVFGIVFAIMFVIIRVYCWTTLTIQYFQDISKTLSFFRDDQQQQSCHPKLLKGGKGRMYLHLNNISLGLITLLQIVWLFEIFRVIKVEIIDVLMK